MEQNRELFWQNVIGINPKQLLDTLRKLPNQESTEQQWESMISPQAQTVLGIHETVGLPTQPEKKELPGKTPEPNS